MGATVRWRGVPAMVLALLLGGAAQAADFRGAFDKERVCFSPQPQGVLRHLCIEYTLHWRLFSLMGEAAVNAVLADWKVTDFAIATPAGTVAWRANLPPALHEAARRLELHVVMDAGVRTPGVAAFPWLRLDSGSPTRQGTPSYNVPGSPDWAKLFHTAAPQVHATGTGRVYHCVASPPAWASAGTAKTLMRGELTLAPTIVGASVFCANLSSVGNTGALSRAIREVCDGGAALRPSWCAPRKGHKPQEAPASQDDEPERRAPRAAAGCRGGPVDPLDRTAGATGDCDASADPLDRTAGTGTGRQGGIDPRNPQALSRAVTMDGATATYGGLPAASGTPGSRPRIRALVREVTTSNGSTAQIPFECHARQPLRRTYVQVEGASRHLRLDSAATGTECDGEVALRLPTELLAGNFCVLFAVEDRAGQVSNTEKACLKALKLGSGTLQISLSWSTDGTDVDLHVREPGGQTIYFARPSSASGGRLDRDDRDGFGPENIYWNGNAPDGSYFVDVKLHAGRKPTRYVVTVNAAGGHSQVRTGVLTRSGERARVLRFVKNGDRISFD